MGMVGAMNTEPSAAMAAIYALYASGDFQKAWEAIECLLPKVVPGDGIRSEYVALMHLKADLQRRHFANPGGVIAVYQELVAALQKLAEKEPAHSLYYVEFPQCMTRLGLAYSDAGNYEMASIQLEKAERLWPSPSIEAATVRLFRAEAAEKSGGGSNLALANKLYGQALQMLRNGLAEPSDPLVLRVQEGLDRTKQGKR